MLGWVDTDDGEPFTAHFLDTGTDDTIRLLQRLVRAGFQFTLDAAASSWTVKHFGSPEWGKAKVLTRANPHQQSKLPALQRRDFFSESIIPVSHEWH